MSTPRNTSRTTGKTPYGTAASIGALAGIVAAVVMASYAVLASWAQGDGFFTPLYHLAAVWSSETAMHTSQREAMTGSDFHFVFGSALLGVLVQLITGAVYGAIFGLLVSRFVLPLLTAAGVGLVYGLVVMVVSAYLVLPLAESLFGSSQVISDMPTIVGWGNFTIEHLLYGLVLPNDPPAKAPNDPPAKAPSSGILPGCFACHDGRQGGHRGTSSAPGSPPRTANSAFRGHPDQAVRGHHLQRPGPTRNRSTA